MQHIKLLDILKLNTPLFSHNQNNTTPRQYKKFIMINFKYKHLGLYKNRNKNKQWNSCFRFIKVTSITKLFQLK